MIAHGFTSSANVAAHWTADATRADATVADDARTIYGELTIVGADRDRDEPDVAGHRATDLTTSEVA